MTKGKNLESAHRENAHAIGERKLSLLQQIEKRIPWGFIGGILGVIGLYVGFHEKSAALTFEVVSESSLLDVRTSRPDVTVLFQGQDIEARNQSLRLVRVAVTNTGELGIQTGDYDQGDTLGFSVSGARPIEARVVSATSRYLRQRTTPKILPTGVVALPKLILDRGHGYVVEVLLLQPKSTPLAVNTYGKVSGIDQIDVTRRQPQSAARSLRDDLLRATLTQHAARLAIYFGSGIVLLISFVVSIAYIGEKVSVRRKRKRDAALRSHLGVGQGSNVDLVYSLWKDFGSTGLWVADHIARSAKDAPELLKEEITSRFVVQELQNGTHVFRSSTGNSTGGRLSHRHSMTDREWLTILNSESFQWSRDDLTVQDGFLDATERALAFFGRDVVYNKAEAIDAYRRRQSYLENRATRSRALEEFRDHLS